MTNLDLATSYMKKAVARLGILDLLLDAEDYSDVVREAQEIVELALKAMLRRVGIDPPKWHDVGYILVENERLFLPDVAKAIPELNRISKSLRRERELSFYGDIDFIPTEEYSAADSERAYDEAAWVVVLAGEVIERLGR